jgi:hypothetical protein
MGLEDVDHSDCGGGTIPAGGAQEETGKGEDACPICGCLPDEMDHTDCEEEIAEKKAAKVPNTTLHINRTNF